MLEKETIVLENSLLRDNRRDGYAVASALFAFFFFLAGVMYLSGRTENTLIVVLLGVFFPIYILILTTAMAHFRIPAKVTVSDSETVFQYRKNKTRRVAWAEVQKYHIQSSIDSLLGKKKGGILRFETKSEKIAVNVDNVISKALKTSYESWCSRVGSVVSFVEGSKLQVEEIVAGEGKRIRGFATMVFGVVVGVVALASAHLLIGLSYIPFTILVLIIVMSCSGFFLFWGAADVYSDPKYLKYAIVTFLGGMVSVAAFLAVVTARADFIVALVYVIVVAIMAYVLIWRRIPKKRGRV